MRRDPSAVLRWHRFQARYSTTAGTYESTLHGAVVFEARYLNHCVKHFDGMRRVGRAIIPEEPEALIGRNLCEVCQAGAFSPGLRRWADQLAVQKK